MLQHFSKSSSINPILQYPHPTYSNIPPMFHHPPKNSKIPPNTPASPKKFQHPPKAPASPQHQALVPLPTAPHTAPHGAQLRAAFGAATTQLGREGLVLRTPGSRDTATGGRYEVSLVPCPQPLSRCRAGAGVPAGGCRPGSGPDPAAGRRVRTSGRREEGQVQGKMPSSWKRPSPPRLGWNKPQHPSCAAAAPGRGN